MIEKDAKRAIALGYFDGVHRGHQALMDLAVKRAKENGAISSVFTFDAHPDTVITGQRVPLIVSENRRGEEIRERGGVDEVIFAHFNDEMRNMEWQKFVDDVLVGQFHACCGLSQGRTITLDTADRAIRSGSRRSASAWASAATLSKMSRLTALSSARRISGSRLRWAIWSRQPSFWDIRMP